MAQTPVVGEIGPNLLRSSVVLNDQDGELIIADRAWRSLGQRHARDSD